MKKKLLTAKMFYLLARLTRDLSRLDDVIEMNQTLARLGTTDDIARAVEEVRSHPAGARALRERPRLGRVSVEELCELPSETLGGAYGRFMRARGLRPESLPDLAAESDMDFILAHSYETHDLWHVVTGFDTDPAGEAGLQAFYLAQTRAYLPFFILSSLLINTAVQSYDEKGRRLDAIVRGWELGKSAERLFGFNWQGRFASRLDAVREELKLPCS